MVECFDPCPVGPVGVLRLAVVDLVVCLRLAVISRVPGLSCTAPLEIPLEFRLGVAVGDRRNFVVDGEIDLVAREEIGSGVAALRVRAAVGETDADRLIGGTEFAEAIEGWTVVGCVVGTEGAGVV